MDLPSEDEIRSVERPQMESGAAPKEPCVNGPQTQRPPLPAARVLGWLAECERTQISHSFALLKQVRWWEEPAAWNFECRRLRIRASTAGPPYTQFPFFSFETLGS